VPHLIIRGEKIIQIFQATKGGRLVQQGEKYAYLAFGGWKYLVYESGLTAILFIWGLH